MVTAAVALKSGQCAFPEHLPADRVLHEDHGAQPPRREGGPEAARPRATAARVPRGGAWTLARPLAGTLLLRPVSPTVTGSQPEPQTIIGQSAADGETRQGPLFYLLKSDIDIFRKNVNGKKGLSAKRTFLSCPGLLLSPRGAVTFPAPLRSGQARPLPPKSSERAVPRSPLRAWSDRSERAGSLPAPRRPAWPRAQLEDSRRHVVVVDQSPAFH